MLAAKADRSPELIRRHDQDQEGGGVQSPLRRQSEDREGQMTDVLGTGTRAWRAEKPSVGDRAGAIDYKTLGAEILHSARSMGLGVGGEHEHRDTGSASRWNAQSLMTWGCRAAWLAVLIAVARISWHVVMNLMG